LVRTARDITTVEDVGSVMRVRGGKKLKRLRS
jgi:hypothetical protein